MHKLLERYRLDGHLEPDGSPTETHTSWLLPVRHAGQPAMLKVPKPGSDERACAGLLRYFAGGGAVHLLAGNDAAVLMERADDAVSLRAMAVSGGDDTAADILAGCVAMLHAPRDDPAPDELTALRDWFRSLFRRAAELPVLACCADVASHLLAEEREVTVLHGDLHHDNVLHSGRGWLAIDPKGLCGERSYEVANLLGNPWPHGELVHHPDRMLRLSRLYAARLGLDVDRVLRFAFAHAGLAASWSMEDGLDPAYRLRCAEILAPLTGRNE